MTRSLAFAAILGATSIGQALGAQSSAALPLAPPPALAAVDTSTSEFDADGVHVILRHNNASDVIAANIYLLGGVQQLTPATQGIEAFLLAASERGTKRFPKDALRIATNKTGSVITIEPEDDWTVFGLHAARTTFDSSWAIFADRLTSPTLDSGDVELVRAQLVSAASQQRLHPDAELRIVADSLLFVGHPYALSTEGTERSLAAISQSALKNYLTTQS